MPLYEYACEVCGHRFEVIQQFSAAPLDTCPKCGGAVRKLQSAPAFHFKGSGWYITDYARKDQAGGTKDSSKESVSESKGTKNGSDKSGASDQSASTGSTPPAAPAPSTTPSKD